MKKQNVIVNTLIVCLLIFGIINVSLFPYQNKYEDYKQLNTENDEGFNEIKNQASYTMTISSYGGDTVIYFIHERGSNYIEWDIDLKYDLSGTCANLWQMELWTFNNLQYSYSVETGQYVSNGNAEFFNRNAPPSKSISNDMYASQTCKSSLYLLNTSDGGVSDTTCNPGADGTTFNGADTLSSTINSFTGSGLMAYVYYLLRPSIILNSTFYNTLNTRIEIMDKESNQWIEYNYDSIVLTNPEYKCKIYSLDTNQLIYEDTDYILFANHRTINIDSVKFSNNDDETIIIDTQNNANFKGYYSFNENIVNTQPNESVWDFSTANDDRSYIHSSEDGHNKVLYSNSETMIDYSVKDYKVDGTLDWGNYTDPDLSEFSIESTYDVNVIAEKNQHENVLECSSEANDDYLYAYPDSSTETIIEYWHCSEKNINFVDMRDTSTIIGRIYFSEPNIYVYSGTSFYSVYSSYERGTWIHVRVEFNQNQSTYDVYLDAELVADDYDYYSTTGNGFLYSVNFRSRDGTILYLDSIAFAQDSNYRTFSNRIYQDYKSNTGIIQTNGSIDSAFNYWDYKTSEGATCEQWGNLTDPDLSEWTFYHMGGTIVDLENHRNVLKLNDTGAGLGYTTDDITEQTGTCTVEFWFYMVQQASTFQFMFRDGATNAWSLRINSTLGIELYSNGYSVDETGIYLKKNQWVNFGMVFTKNDDIEFYMNHDSIGILSTGNYDIDSIRIYNPAGPFEFYVDGLGYSWNSYSLYDNSYIYEWFDNSEANSSIDVLSEYYIIIMF